MTTSPNRQRGRTGPQPMLTAEHCREIAREFDGTTKSIDQLLAKWRLVVPGLKRHNIIAAARRGGYVTKNGRKPWTTGELRFLRESWHRLSVNEIAQQLGRSRASVDLRRKRLGLGRRDRSSSGTPDRDETSDEDPPSIDLRALRDRISAQQNPFLSLLAWRRDSLKQAA